MLRRIILVLMLVLEPCLVVLRVTHIYAVSPNLVIYQVQTGATNAATQEYVSLNNKSSQAVDVSNWCVTYGSASDTTQTILGCITSPNINTKIMLPTSASLTLASNEFVNAHPGFAPDIIFSAGISATSGHIRILDANKQEVDRLGWGAAVHPEGTAVAAHTNGNTLRRLISEMGQLQDTDNNAADFAQASLTSLVSSLLYEEQIPVDICANLDGIQTTMPAGYLADATGNCQPDVCLNLDGLQLDMPDGYNQQDNGMCQLIPAENATLLITELLPNAVSYDTGQEFIELYNPNDRPVSLRGYALQLAPSYAKSYNLPDQILAPNEYVALSDVVTGLVLSNITAQLRLVAPSGNVVSSTDTYTSPEEGIAWALIGQTWQYTNQPTPGASNLANLDDEPVVTDNVSGLAPCPTGQYRSAETNRCRLLQAAVSALTPCSPGQERNPATNRCRSVLSASTSLTPCAAGQERNPDTNRCRAVTSSSLQACDPGEERNPDTNRCRKAASASNAGGTITKVKDVATAVFGNGVKWWLAGLTLSGALGYGIYEWRHDLVNRWHRRRARTISKV